MSSPIETHCLFCGTELPPPAKTGGQRRKYCSDTHRVYAFKLRVAEAEDRRRERRERRDRKLRALQNSPLETEP